MLLFFKNRNSRLLSRPLNTPPGISVILLWFAYNPCRDGGNFSGRFRILFPLMYRSYKFQRRAKASGGTTSISFLFRTKRRIFLADLKSCDLRTLILFSDNLRSLILYGRPAGTSDRLQLVKSNSSKWKLSLKSRSMLLSGLSLSTRYLR